MNSKSAVINAVPVPHSPSATHHCKGGSYRVGPGVQSLRDCNATKEEAGRQQDLS